MKPKVALVTGASRGIGRAIAVQLAGDGFQVVVNYHSNEEKAREVVEEIKSRGGEATAIAADVADSEAASRLVKDTAGCYGRIDVLVNNAGINQDQLLLRISDADWEKILTTNLNSAFYCSRAAIKLMLRQRYGRIISISSVVGINGNAGQVHYAASKAGLIGMARSIAREYGSRGINANIVAPGYIASDMTSDLNEEIQQKMLEGIAVGRLGTPQDVAGVVAFLVSNQADYLSGQVIRVDGGMSAL